MTIDDLFLIPETNIILYSKSNEALRAYSMLILVPGSFGGTSYTFLRGYQKFWTHLILQLHFDIYFDIWQFYCYDYDM